MPIGEVSSAGPSSPHAAAGETSHPGGIAEPLSQPSPTRPLSTHTPTAERDNGTQLGASQFGQVGLGSGPRHSLHFTVPLMGTREEYSYCQKRFELIQ